MNHKICGLGRLRTFCNPGFRSGYKFVTKLVNVLKTDYNHNALLQYFITFLGTLEGGCSFYRIVKQWQLIVFLWKGETLLIINLWKTIVYLAQTCLRAPHMVADEAKLAIVFTYFFLLFLFSFFFLYFFQNRTTTDF